MRVRAWARRVGVRTRSLTYSAFKTYAPYYTVIPGLSGSTIFFHIISQMI